MSYHSYHAIKNGPCASGVYQICCIPTRKIYVGSAVNIAKRWGEHVRALRRGKHRNCHLQNAWNKYGEGQFEFSVLEYVDVIHLLQAEQEWIDSTACVDKEIGFNICGNAEAPGGVNIQLWEGFIDPNGKEVAILGLQEFCIKEGLDYRSMHRLAKGKSKLKSYRGWTHKNSVRQRDYVKTYSGFIDPDGNPVEPITNLAEFCRERGLDNTHMLAVMRGRICSHHGWTHISGRKPLSQKTYTGFISPNGESVIIINLSLFCRENNLHHVKMRQLMSGKCRRYKGWTWRETNDTP